MLHVIHKKKYIAGSLYQLFNFIKINTIAFTKKYYFINTHSSLNYQNA
jgi:hypothetical protein